MAKWLEFLMVGATPSGKTLVWEVRALNGGARLGHVSWFGRWRCYAFWPDPRTIYERECLRDIADFCERETKLRAEKRKGSAARVAAE